MHFLFWRSWFQRALPSAHMGRTMPKVYLSNHDVHSQVLAYDTETGALARHARTELPLGKETDRGFYTEVDGEAYGVFATADGPVFFVGNQRTPLVRGTHAVTLRKGSKSHRFSLTAGGDEVASVWYRAPTVAGTNPYDDDASFQDFFAWVEAGIDTDRFYDWHTSSTKKASAFGEYLWVRNRKTGIFVERYRVIKLGEDEDSLPDRGDVDGVVAGADANDYFQSLVDKHHGAEFECGRTYATGWMTVEKQVVALRDYDYD
jgi:hypothetical protein